MSPDAPTIILIGGPFTADTGETLDSRQPFVDDPASAIAQNALAGSELWWLTAASLVMPLLAAEGTRSAATVSGPRSVVSLKPDGTLRRRRLGSVLPGGVRPKQPEGRWQLVDMGGLWQGGDTRVVVDAWGLFWRNALCLNSFKDFELYWVTDRNQIVIGPHTSAATRYFDGYVQWVADGRPTGDSGASLPNPDHLLSANTPLVVPIESDFAVTALVQNGVWKDAAPVEAARALLRARFDLKLGFWDLVNNDILRATLLKSVPSVTPPTTAAPMTVGALKRYQARQDSLSDERKQYDAYCDALAGVVASLDDLGWSSALVGQSKQVSRFRRSLPFAFAPDCGDPVASDRHLALRPGMPILWIQIEVVPDSRGFGTVDLVAPEPFSELWADLAWSFLISQQEASTRIAHPHRASTKVGGGGRTVFSGLIEFVRMASEPTIADWTSLLDDIVGRVPALIHFLTPLTETMQRHITANPQLGCTTG